MTTLVSHLEPVVLICEYHLQQDVNSGCQAQSGCSYRSRKRIQPQCVIEVGLNRLDGYGEWYQMALVKYSLNKLDNQYQSL